jgi:hypothetical protein
MVAAGRGYEPSSFTDRNSSAAPSIRTMPVIYLGYLDPQGRPIDQYNPVAGRAAAMGRAQPIRA